MCHPRFILIVICNRHVASQQQMTYNFVSEAELGRQQQTGIPQWSQWTGPHRIYTQVKVSSCSNGVRCSPENGTLQRVEGVRYEYIMERSSPKLFNGSEWGTRKSKPKFSGKIHCGLDPSCRLLYVEFKSKMAHRTKLLQHKNFKLGSVAAWLFNETVSIDIT
jgi:hypothetical protein